MSNVPRIDADLAHDARNAILDRLASIEAELSALNARLATIEKQATRALTLAADALERLGPVLDAAAASKPVQRLLGRR